MTENIEVFVNGAKVVIFRGMKVKHALIAYDQSLYEAAVNGEALVVDANGFVVGLDGALTEGTRIFVKSVVP